MRHFNEYGCNVGLFRFFFSILSANRILTIVKETQNVFLRDNSSYASVKREEKGK